MLARTSVQLLRSLTPRAETRRFSSIPSSGFAPGRSSTKVMLTRGTARTFRTCSGENGYSSFISNRLNRFHHLLHRSEPNFVVRQFRCLDQHGGNVSKASTEPFVHLSGTDL